MPRSAGGLIIVENPRTAEAAQMPQGAFDAASAALVLELADIGPYLARLGHVR